MPRSIPPFLRPALEKYAARLREKFGDRLRQVRLFGSFARGDANEDSDVDVLVLIDGLTDSEVGIAVGEAMYVLLETKLPLAPLAMSIERFGQLRHRERLLAKDIDAEGISL